MLRIFLLGNPHAFEKDKPLPLPAPGKAFLLWAYLLLNRQRPISRDHLAYLLWPDVPEAEARANLRRHLHLLRRQLPPPPQDSPWILTIGNTVQWNPQAAYSLDVAYLEEFDESTADEAQWSALVDEYGGKLLEGYYDDWILADRTSLHQRYLYLLECRIARQKAGGDLQGAILTTQRSLAHDRLREEPYRHLMELFYRVGDRAAALREFERCESLLRAELGAELMPETLALRDAIVRGADLEPLSQPALPALPLTVAGRATSSQTASRSFGRRGLKWGLVAVAVLLVLVAGGLLVSGVLPLRLVQEPVSATLSGPAVTQDTWLNHQSPDLPYDPLYSEDLYAAYPQVHLQYFNYPYDRVLIRFDLRQLPAEITLKRAVFRIHLETFTNEDLPEPLPATISAFRILRPWQHDTATFNSPWSQPGLDPGVDFDIQPLGSQSILGTDWVSIDVTDLVSEWLADPEANWGMVVMITEAPQGAHYWVDTADYPLSNRQPGLDVTYLP